MLLKCHSKLAHIFHTEHIFCLHCSCFDTNWYAIIREPFIILLRITTPMRTLGLDPTRGNVFMLSNLPHSDGANLTGSLWESRGCHCKINQYFGLHHQIKTSQQMILVCSFGKCPVCNGVYSQKNVTNMFVWKLPQCTIELACQT